MKKTKSKKEIFKLRSFAHEVKKKIDVQTNNDSQKTIPFCFIQKFEGLPIMLHNIFLKTTLLKLVIVANYKTLLLKALGTFCVQIRQLLESQ